MILYLLKSAACLLILLLVHQFLLQRESMHRFNRFFLLFSVVVSFLIPVYVIEVAGVPVVEESGRFEILENVGQSEYAETDTNSESIPTVKDLDFREEKSIPWIAIFWSLYLSITLVFLIRFVRNIRILADKISRNLHVSYRGETLVLLAENSLPFTFLKFIFISKTYFEEGKLTEAIFAHERAHLREKHSLDLLFIELLLVFFWFHPGLYFARQAIKLNHEFIADQAALQATTLEIYQSQLLSMMVSGQSFKLASSLNFSLTKKRFEMMRRKTANSTKWIKILSVIPVLAVLVYFFGEKIAVQPEEEVVVDTSTLAPERPVESVEIEILLLSDREVEFNGKVFYLEHLAELIQGIDGENTLVKLSANPRVEMGVLADVQEILRENELRKVVFEESRKNMLNTNWEKEEETYYQNAFILVEDENMDYTHKTYQQLTEKEKKGLFGRWTPPSKKIPHPMTFEEWKNKEKYALWLDEKVISQEELTKLHPSDIVLFWSSRVMENARSARFPQPFQVHLYTEEYYEKELGPDSDRLNPLTNHDTITITQRRVIWHRDIQKYPDPNTAFLQKNARYEKLRNSGVPYSQKSQQEQEEINSLYQELNKEYSKSSDIRKKSLKQPFPPQNQTENQKSVSASNENSQKSLTAFGELNGAYQVKLNQKGLFANKTEIEIKELFEFYTTLQEKYTALSYEDKRVIRTPIFPYARFERDGKVIFKRFEDLTEAERKEQKC